MKKGNFIWALLAVYMIVLLLTSCSKDEPAGQLWHDPAQDQLVIGESGVDGQDGEDGADGTNGVDGQDGTDGTDGVNGSDGVDGVDGTNGTDGVDGIDGQDGQDGQDGVDSTHIIIYLDAPDPDINLTCSGELVKIVYGYDTSGDLILFGDEIAGSFLWCKPLSDSVLVVTSQKVPAGGTCINGGHVLIFANDIDGSGTVNDGDEEINIITICE